MTKKLIFNQLLEHTLYYLLIKFTNYYVCKLIYKLWLILHTCLLPVEIKRISQLIGLLGMSNYDSFIEIEDKVSAGNL